jgi:NADH:ubiquinone oxidoreductase subunit 5 (subunit L)/multisubunit Na+/H+ antiporter MnhA subunit
MLDEWEDLQKYLPCTFSGIMIGKPYFDGVLRFCLHSIRNIPIIEATLGNKYKTIASLYLFGGTLTAFLTAFYSGRLLILCF